VSGVSDAECGYPYRKTPGSPIPPPADDGDPRDVT